MRVTPEEIRELVAKTLGLAQVSDDDLIIEDLGAESIDVVRIVSAVEERWGLLIEETELLDLRTPAALFQRVRAAQPTSSS